MRQVFRGRAPTYPFQKRRCARGSIGWTVWRIVQRTRQH